MLFRVSCTTRAGARPNTCSQRCFSWCSNLLLAGVVAFLVRQRCRAFEPPGMSTVCSRRMSLASLACCSTRRLHQMCLLRHLRCWIDIPSAFQLWQYHDLWVPLCALYFLATSKAMSVNVSVHVTNDRALLEAVLSLLCLQPSTAVDLSLCPP